MMTYGIEISFMYACLFACLNILLHFPPSPKWAELGPIDLMTVDKIKNDVSSFDSMKRNRMFQYLEYICISNSVLSPKVQNKSGQ